MPQADWSEAEQWTWEQVHAGNIANFQERLGKLDPRSGAGWNETRLLTPVFIREIFYEKSLRGEIPPEGVRIVGAWFRDRLALPSGRLHSHLWLDGCRFDQGIDFLGQRIQGWLSLAGTFLGSSADSSAAVDLTSANIDGMVSFDRSTIEGRLTMNGLRVSQSLLMRGSKEQPARFAEVDLTGAHIEGYLDLTGATVAGRLTMRALQVGQSLLMEGSEEQPASFAE